MARETTSANTTTTIQTKEQFYASQKKNTSFFSKICTGAKSLFCSIFGAEYSYIMEYDNGERLLPYNSPVNIKYVSKDTEVINQIGDSSKLISVYFQTVDNGIDLHSSAGIKLNLFGFSASLNFGVKNTGISISYNNDNTTSYFGYGASFEDLSINCNTGITEAYSDTGSYTNGGEASINAILAYQLYCYFEGIPYSEQYDTANAH